VLKEIVAASREHGHSSHVLYPTLLDLSLDLFHIQAIPESEQPECVLSGVHRGRGYAQGS